MCLEALLEASGRVLDVGCHEETQRSRVQQRRVRLDANHEELERARRGGGGTVEATGAQLLRLWASSLSPGRAKHLFEQLLSRREMTASLLDLFASLWEAARLASMQMDRPAPLSPSACRLLSRGIAFRRLSHLSLKGCLRLDDRSILALSEAPFARLCLRSLDLSFCPSLTDASLIRVARSMPFLTALLASDLPSATDQSLTAIAAAPMAALLCALDLSRCRITDTGIRHLTSFAPPSPPDETDVVMLHPFSLTTNSSASSASPSLPSSSLIALCNRPFHNATPDPYANIALLTSLQTLRAAGNLGITDQSARLLATGFPALQHLDLSATRVSAGGFAQVTKSLRAHHDGEDLVEQLGPGLQLALTPRFSEAARREERSGEKWSSAALLNFIWTYRGDDGVPDPDALLASLQQVSEPAGAPPVAKKDLAEQSRDGSRTKRTRKAQTKSSVFEFTSSEEEQPAQKRTAGRSRRSAAASSSAVVERSPQPSIFAREVVVRYIAESGLLAESSSDVSDDTFGESEGDINPTEPEDINPPEEGDESDGFFEDSDEIP